MTRLFLKTFTALLLIALCSFSSLFAQSVDIEWGEAMENDNFIVETLGQTEDGVYALAIRYDNLFLEYYEGNKLTLKFSKEIVLPKIDSVKLKVRRALFLKGQLSVIAYSQHKGILKVYGFLMGRDGEIQPKPVEILSFPFVRKGEEEAIKITTSRDHSKMLVYSRAYFLADGKEGASDICVLNTKLDILKKVSEEPQEKVLNACLKNNGAVYMAVKRDEDVIIRQYEPANNFERQDIGINLPDLQIPNLSLIEDGQGDIISGGFYGVQGKKRINLEGTFFFKIDHTKAKMVISKTAALSQDFFSNILTEKQLKKGRRIPHFFRTKHLIAKADGGIVMIGEYKEIRILSADKLSVLELTTHAHIIIVDIAANGKTNWMRSIIKTQYSSSSIARRRETLFNETGGFRIRPENFANYHSFILAMKGNKIYLIYNDNPKNIETISAQKTKYLMHIKKAIPVVVIIDPAGNIKKELYKGGKEEVALIPFASSQKSYSNVIIHGSRGKEKKFGRLILK